VNMNLYLSSFVQRWHTDARLAPKGQNLGHHQWGVATLILTLHPNPSRSLILAALTHDAGEFLTGDHPYGFKHLYPALAAQVEQAGAEERDDMLGFRLEIDETEQAWLEMCDRLESVLYVSVHDPDRLRQEDWKKVRNQTEGWAFGLGVAGPVTALLRETLA
jgi:5'-deoxynucleotidase YfbR-like HD superfamily hydrolase